MRKFLLASSMLLALAACSAAASQNSLASPVEVEAMDAVSVAEAMQAEPAPMAREAAPVRAEAARYEPAAMSCDIDARRSGGMVRLVAFASSDVPASGEYELVFTKHDAGGSSDIMQGGEFDVSRGHQELGVIETSLERGGRFSARLTISDADGVVCETDLRR